MYDRLKELRPKHGVESQPVTSITRDSDELECNRQDLIFIKKIGEGKYGEIILMKTKNLYGCLNVPVAVKALSRSVEEMKDRFFAEIELLQGVHHPNIVHLFGYCIDSYNTSSLEAPPLMILEYMALGDLLNILIANKPKEGVVSNLETKHLFSFAADIARALLYLSEQNYVHRDVAARNVLVAQNLTAKLTDFRLTQKVDENGQYQLKESGSLPIRWMSPESLLDGIYSVHTDCWAYGVLLWEMVTYGEFPHEISDMIKVTEAAENKQLRVIPPHGCHRVLASVIEECQSHEPEMRPTFQSLIDSITITLENFNSNVESTAV
jgi:serine/threonine protein kinase